MGHSASHAKRKVHSTVYIRTKSNKKLERCYASNLTVYIKALEQEEISTPEKRQQEIIK